MKRLKLSAGPGDGGKRLDLFLGTLHEELASRSQAQRLIKEGRVLVNGQTAKGSHRIKEGEEISIEIPPAPPSHLEPQDIPVPVLYEDDELIVVEKPAGLVTHPGAGRRDGTLVNALLYHCRSLAPTSDPVRPGIVHRLDKDSSGLMVVAKTPRAHAHLALQFKNRTIERLYRAFVLGVVEFDEGRVDAPIGRHPVNPKKRAVVPAGGKPALSLYKVLRRYRDVTDLEVKIKTGRTHQVRVHLAHLGHPVVGDREYGRADERITRPALHAFVLGFKHPVTGERLRFERPLPEDMRRFLNSLD